MKDFLVTLQETIFRAASSANEQKATPDIAFFSLPYWDIFTPFSAVPCLVAALAEAGYTSRNMDLGILQFHCQLRKRHRMALAFVKSRFFYTEKVVPYEKSPVQTYEEYLAQLSFLEESSGDFARLKGMYPQLTDFQRQLVFYFFQGLLLEKKRTPNRLNLRPSALVAEGNFTSFASLVSLPSVADLLVRLPKVCGISITSLDQLAASCFWALLLRHLRPDITLVAGGSCMTILRNCNPAAFREMFAYVDYISLGEGETCLVRLLDYLQGKTGDISSVPNLAYLDGENVVQTACYREDIERLPPPDYDDVDQSLYLTPEPMLSYQTSRGCFWGKCAFCDFDKAWRTNFRQKSPEKVNRDLEYLHTRYGVSAFTFVDEAIEPRFFAQWIPTLHARPFSRQITWLAYMKVSRFYTDELVALAHEAGLHMVMLGVETFSQRLLNLLRKGIAVKDTIRNLELFQRHGVKTHAWMMGVLPTQSLEEMREDCRMIERYADRIDNIVYGQFRLLPSTDIFACPEKFGVSDIRPSGDGAYDGYEFTSTLNGNTCDLTALTACLHEEISPLLRRKFLSDQRYSIFFDSRYFAKY